MLGIVLEQAPFLGAQRCRLQQRVLPFCVYTHHMAHTDPRGVGVRLSDYTGGRATETGSDWAQGRSITQTPDLRDAAPPHRPPPPPCRSTTQTRG